MGEFSNYLGVLECKVGDKSLRLRPTLRHKQQLMALMTKAQKGDFLEKDVNEQHSIFLDILGKSYPTEKREDLENFLLVNDIQFMIELFVGFGWSDRDKLEELKKNTLKIPNQ